MEEAIQSSKELSYSAHANGMNEWMNEAQHKAMCILKYELVFLLPKFTNLRPEESS